MEPVIHTVFEPFTSTWQYVVADPATKAAIIIDPVLDFDPARNAISTVSADGLLSLVKENGYTVEKLLETHAHADHLTAASYLQHRLEAASGKRPTVGIGKRIAAVQERFARRYGIDRAEWEGVFDELLDDDQVFQLGQLQARVMHLPGHTPDHVGYLVGSNLFCGDSLFNPDVGTARCDFPSGDAHELYASINKLFALPDTYRVYTGHDYPPSGESGEGPREPIAHTIVGEQKARNKHLRGDTPKESFVAWRKNRDAGLGEPRLLHQSLQFNIRAGRLPRRTEAGDRFLTLPLKLPVSGWTAAAADEVQGDKL